LTLPSFPTRRSSDLEYNETPEDAYIDRVWKKTPGRNGLKVNIDKSYEKMKKNKVFNESQLVVEQIVPQVSLEDLEPSPIFRGHPDRKSTRLNSSHVS